MENAFSLNNEFDDNNDNLLFTAILGLMEQFTFNYVLNIRGWQEKDSERFILNYSQGWNEKLSWFVEPYFDQTGSEWQNKLNFGLGYLVHKDLLVDLSAGNDLDGDEYRFISMGFSVRR